MPPSIAPPHFEDSPALLIAGYNGSFDQQTRVQIPELWSRFSDWIGKVPGQIGTAAYGVCWKYDANGRFEYLCGVEVASEEGLPDQFMAVSLAPQRYAVFTHEGHHSKLPESFQAIWRGWFPQSGMQEAEAPGFERYTEEFNPQTGSGGTEIWVPVLPD